MACDHAGAHSGASRYIREDDQLRLVLVCDECGAERTELGRLDYRTQASRSVEPAAGLTGTDLGLSTAEV
jgi:hypothetical protein